jgi:hypothetical protein
LRATAVARQPQAAGTGVKALLLHYRCVRDTRERETAVTVDTFVQTTLGYAPLGGNLDVNRRSEKRFRSRSARRRSGQPSRNDKTNPLPVEVPSAPWRCFTSQKFPAPTSRISGRCWISECHHDDQAREPPAEDERPLWLAGIVISAGIHLNRHPRPSPLTERSEPIEDRKRCGLAAPPTPWHRAQ